MGRKIRGEDVAAVVVSLLLVVLIVRTLATLFVPRAALEGTGVIGVVLFSIGFLVAVFTIDRVDANPLFWVVLFLAAVAMTLGCLLILGNASAVVNEKISVEVSDLSLLCDSGRAAAAVVWIRTEAKGVADLPIVRVALYADGTLVGEVGKVGTMRGDGVTELSVLVPTRGLPCEPRNLSVVVQLGNLVVRTLPYKGG